MHILYVVPFVPWPIKVRSFNLIPRLARRHEIHLVCVSSETPTVEQRQWIDRYCKSVVHVRHPRWKGIVHCAAALPTMTPLRMAYCSSRTAQREVGKACEKVQPDVIYVERWRALRFIPKERSAPLVCDPTDSMTLYNQRMMNAGTWWERALGWEEYTKFRRCEGKLAREADATVFCSRVDMECVREQAPEVKCELVPNGVDCRKFFLKQENEEEPATLVFTGSFKYRPNYLAAKSFLDEIFPIIQAEVPQARFLAVGNAASRALVAYRGRAGFEAVDYVPDLRPYLAKATVAVAPLTVGAGVSNKIAEGFAVGTPVVATALACGDLPVVDGEHLLIAANPRQFAENVLRLLSDARLRRQMALRARRVTERRYNWEIVSKRMENVLCSLVEESDKASEPDRLAAHEFLTEVNPRVQQHL
jgi:glycosyltransferase involved in cell wall biosynthesis